MQDIRAVAKWYKDNRSLYVLLAKKVEDIITDSLKQNKIDYHSVTSRAKSRGSFAAKAQKETYNDPINDIKDMAGIRVIAYLDSDVVKIAKLVESLFDIDRDNSFDQSKLLGSDRVGYRSVHYVAHLGEKRCKLPEYKLFANLPFEIQIRSLLQHAWAEIEHDRNYKFSGKLPTELQRRFYLVAGMLEVADREFVFIAEEIDKYKSTVTERLKKDNLDIEINTISLKEYLSGKFAGIIEEGLLLEDFGDETKLVVEELQLFGVSRLSQLDKIVPEDFQDKVRSILKLQLHPKLDLTITTRLLLIIKNAKKYFGLSWRNNWHFIKKSHIKLLHKYGVDVVYVRKCVGENM